MAKKKSGKKQLILDTSVQIERVKFPEFEREIAKLTSKYDLYTLNFVYYEYKVGIVLSFIDYYHTVQSYGDVSKANMMWSDKIGRDPKYLAIIQGLLARINKSIQFEDISEYLDKLEVIILYLLKRFDVGVRGQRGNFAGDSIVKYDLYDSSTYRGFIDLRESRKIIPLTDFWQKNHEALLSLVGSQLLEQKYNKFHGRLKEISDNLSKADSFWVNTTTGDAVIATDTPKNYAIVTTDNIFSYLTSALNKELLLLQKKTE